MIKIYTALLLSLSFFFSASAIGQTELPDSISTLIDSQDNVEQAKGWQQASMYFFKESDSLNYRNAIEAFHALPLEDLPESNKIEIVRKHSSFLLRNFQYSAAKEILLRLIESSGKQGQLETKAIFHRSIMAHYFYTFQYDSCEMHIDSAITLFNKLGLTDKIGDLTIKKAGTNYAQGNYEIAISLAYEAIEIFKQNENKGKLAVAYLQLGNIFYFLRDYNESMQYYELSLSAFQAINDDEGVYRVISDIGLVNLMLKNYRECINQQLQVIPYFVKNNKELEKGNAYRFLSDSYFGLEKYDSARYYNTKSLKSSLITQYYVGICESYLAESKLSLKENRLKEALLAAKKSFKIADSIQNYESIKFSSDQLSQTYDALGQIDSSYRYLKLYYSLKDSLDIDPNVLKEYAVKHQFQVEEAHFELLLEKEKTKIQKELNKKKQQQLVVVSVVAVISLVLLILAIAFLVKNKKLSKKLEIKQLEVERELENKESLLNEIHHRVKNNLQVISSMLSLQTEYISDDRVHKVITDCKSRINSMSIIHESLYKKTNGVEASFNEYIELLISELIDTYIIDRSKVTASMNLERIHLNLDESIPCGLLINEIISNALKHAFPKDTEGNISIDLFRKEGFVNLQIADNGVGLNVEERVKKQDSFGFLLIDTLVRQLEAEMTCKNENGVKYIIRWKSIS